MGLKKPKVLKAPPADDNKKGTRSMPHTLYDPTEVYACTISLSEPHQAFKTKVCRLRTVVQHYKDLLQFVKYAEFELFPEIGKKNGYIHYHGYIKITDPVQFLLYEKHVLQNSMIVDIDVINDKDVWLEYIQKDKLLMKEACKRDRSKYKYTNSTLSPPEAEGEEG